jgi:glycosyltransferase involved in cell wall biosynthesis
MLTVVSVGYPLAPVGPDAVGGAEQVLLALDAALVAAGHRSIVLAPARSQVAGELVGLPPTPEVIDDAARSRATAATVAALKAVQCHADVVHLHGIDFAKYLPPPGPPVLVTLHLPPDWYAPDALHPTRPDTWLNCVSAAQYRACPASVNLLPPIPNGVPVEALAASHARRGYALMLGRICPEKGQHLALQAAHHADVSLFLAGIAFPYPEHRAYFNEHVAPLLDPRRRCIGQIDFARKRRLLSAARCLLVPSLAAETSSLVAMEALACGTPVIAFRAGALPEVVRDQETGFVVDDVAGMVSAICRTGSIDPQACRTDARNRFSLRRTTEAYLALYERLTRRAA